MKALKRCIFAVGAFQVSTYLYQIGHEIYARNYRKPYDLKDRYGEGSYALVTGATEGIGKSYARALAKRGLNIVLVGRNQEKLDCMKAEMECEYGVLVQTVKYDFLNSVDYTSLQQIDEETKDLDVSILVNNVGISAVQSFVDLEPKEINDLLVTNVFPVTFLSHAFERRFLKREGKSAIINVGSENGEVPFPYMQVYSGTKSYINHFTKSLQPENSGKIDVLLHVAGFTRTNIGNRQKEQLDPKHLSKVATLETMAADPDECTRDVLNSLGHETYVPGALSHVIALELTKMFSPISIWARGYAAKKMISWLKKDEEPPKSE